MQLHSDAVNSPAATAVAWSLWDVVWPKGHAAVFSVVRVVVRRAGWWRPHLSEYTVLYESAIKWNVYTTRIKIAIFTVQSAAHSL